MKVWVVGRGGDHGGEPFEFFGVFDTEDAAVEACCYPECWIGPSTLNEALGAALRPEWEGLRFPKAVTE